MRSPELLFAKELTIFNFIASMTKWAPIIKFQNIWKVICVLPTPSKPTVCLFVCLFRNPKLECPVTVGRSPKKQSLLDSVIFRALWQFVRKHVKVKSDFWVASFATVEKVLVVWFYISRKKTKQNCHWQASHATGGISDLSSTGRRRCLHKRDSIHHIALWIFLQ